MKHPTDTPVPCSTQPLHSLRDRIEREAPWLHIIGCAQYPHLSLEVRDSSDHGIHVAFSCDADVSAYIQVIGKGGTHP